MRQSLALFCLFALASMSACASPPPARDGDGANRSAVVLHGQRFSVEIAANDASREHGLMGRTSMPADHGMLFVFPVSTVQTFWMKDTLIPLDMLFLDAHRKVVTLLSDVPPCKADPCPIYPSTQPARYVLELDGGVAAKLGIRAGDIATFINVPPAAQ